MTVARRDFGPVGGLLLCLLASAGITPVCRAQQSDATGRELSFGFQVFHSILEGHGLATTTRLQAVQEDPRNSVLVLLGRLDANELVARARLGSFLERGGVVLLASDQPQWVDELCVLRAGPVLVEAEDAYQGYADCPRVRDFDRTDALTRGLRELIANRSGWVDELFSEDGYWERVVRLPAAEGSTNEPRTLVATMQSRLNRRGRLVVLADHSLLINGMLLHADNARFLLNLATWLCRDGRRQLFIAVDGEPLRADGRPVINPADLPPLPPPESLPPVSWDDLKQLPPEAWLTLGNGVLAAMEDADLHNELAAARPAPLSDRLYWRGVYLAAAVVGGLFVCWQLARGAGRVDPPLPVTDDGGWETLLGQRLAAGEYRPAARALATDLLSRVFHSEQAEDWSRQVSTVGVRGNWLVRWRARRALVTFLAVAGDKQQRPLSGRAFRKLTRRLRLVQALHQQDRLGLPPS